MSSRKYISLEEAAAQLKITPEELIRLREKGEVRGFADRGTWKFKADDIEELGRRQHPDSAPEVPIYEPDAKPSKPKPEKPSVIQRGKGIASDSDVRLLPDEKSRSKLSSSSAEIQIMLSKTDSDVRLVEAPSERLDSDSDVQLVSPKNSNSDTDSDVKLAGSDSDVRVSDSDSDVKLAPVYPSDSDVQLVNRGLHDTSSDSDVMLAPSDSKTKKSSDQKKISPTMSDSVLVEEGRSAFDTDSGIQIAGESDVRLPGDSGISLLGPGDSGIILEGAGESGFPLRGDSSSQLAGPSDSDISFLGDSGISIGDDSGISIQEDSGISMEQDSEIRMAADSGIRMDVESGIRLSDAPESDIKLRTQHDIDELDESIPLLLSKDPSADRTDVEVPMIDDEDEMPTLNLKESPKKRRDTSVVLFNEEEDAASTGTEFEDVDELEIGDLGEEDELEVSEDILGEEEDFEPMEVFEGDDSAFDESFVEGGSSVSIPAVGGGRIALPQEVEWSTGTVVLSGVSVLTLVFGAMLAVDLLRVVWMGNVENLKDYNGGLINAFTWLFG